ncbi:hypothetical protein H671_5g14482 [Cricetulus griseus]|nr:hypothetical protein H671_5g14482 [Cricetulus griseus]
MVEASEDGTSEDIFRPLRESYLKGLSYNGTPASSSPFGLSDMKYMPRSGIVGSCGRRYQKMERSPMLLDRTVFCFPFLVMFPSPKTPYQFPDLCEYSK